MIGHEENSNPHSNQFIHNSSVGYNVTLLTADKNVHKNSITYKLLNYFIAIRQEL